MKLDIFDSYNIRARISVVLFFIIPFFVDWLIIFSSKFTVTENLFAVALLVIIFQSILNLSRPKDKCFRENYVTAAKLLNVKSQLSDITRMRYYRKLATFEPEFLDFSCQKSEWNNKITDDLCESAVVWLRSKTRDKNTFYLIHEENTNYGYYRNMFNLKKAGIILNCVAVFALVIMVLCPHFDSFKPSNFEMLLLVSIHLFQIVYLSLAITKDAVETAAKRYAKSLVEAIDIIA